jgi:LysR family nitrogen assimilation transcriptional regulator
MNLRHLQTFVMVAEAGGIHRAAGRLNLSQPAASRQIQQLEGELGVLLFDRIGRRVQLTSEGQDLLRRCRRLLMEVESVTQRAGALKKGETGTLRVGQPLRSLRTRSHGFWFAIDAATPPSRSNSSRRAARIFRAAWIEVM